MPSLLGIQLRGSHRRGSWGSCLPSGLYYRPARRRAG